MNGESMGNTARFVKNARAMLPRRSYAGKEEKGKRENRPLQSAKTLIPAKAKTRKRNLFKKKGDIRWLSVL